MTRFLDVGYAERDGDRVEIHIGPAAKYEISEKAAAETLVYGYPRDLYQRVPQATFTEEGHTSGLMVKGSVMLSRTRLSVQVWLRTTGRCRHYIINAEALRDVMRRKIPRATVSEIVFAGSKTAAVA